MGREKNSKYDYIGYFLIVLSGFSNHVLLPTSPSVIFWSVVIIFLIFKSRYFSTPISLAGHLLLIQSFYLLTSQIFLEAPMGRVIGILISTSFYFLSVFVLPKFGQFKIIKFSNMFVNFSIGLLIIEFILRVVYPINVEHVERYEQFDDNRWIYKYKESSFMYYDSNGTAIHLLIILFFLIYLNRNKLTKYFYPKFVILNTLIFLTFSRAGIIACLGGLLFYFFFYKTKLSRKIAGGTILGFTYIFVYPYVKSYFSQDLSIKTKFNIYDIAFKYFDTMNMQEFFFGIGITNSIKRFGIYTHDYLLTYFVETGAIGLVLQVGIIYLLVRRTKNIMIILVPFIIATITSINTYLPYLYVSFALIYVIDNLLKNEKKTIGISNNTVL